ncbi:unnamed protein product, partial [Heterotrigona itama]
MSSNKSGSTRNSIPSNVQIKVEPGTSLPVAIQNIKTEPGLSATTRLTSFRLPRDLTLGGNIKTEKPKKVYIPNLNAQRIKKKEDVTQNDSVKSSDKDQKRGRSIIDRGRDRGHGKKSSNLIQSSGIWSTGIMTSPGKRHSSSSRDSDRSSQASLEKPKLDLNRSVDKAEEEEKVKLLLRDDFIDDGDSLNIENAPILLPLIKEVLSPKKELKTPKSSTETKDEFLDNIPNIVENKTNSYILMQFPDCLPGLVNGVENTRPGRSNMSNYEKESKPQTAFCTLNSLKPGILGKLQILKSGKTRLLLGENNLVVDVGSHLTFRQDLIAAKLDTENLVGELINLGPVSSMLLCTPDWESMLAK